MENHSCCEVKWRLWYFMLLPIRHSPRASGLIPKVCPILSMKRHALAMNKYSLEIHVKEGAMKRSQSKPGEERPADRYPQNPRTNDWFLITSPMPGLSIIAAYLYFVITWGPRYMKHRKPYELNNILIAYNFIQVLVSTYLVYEAIDGLWLREDFSFRCQPVNFDRTKEAMREARGVYTYFIAKMTELLDTVFFVLRKKNNQITFLHIYHHTVMPMVSWGCVKYYPGGHGTFVGVVNSFVHIIMYLYYMLSAFGPKIHKYLWWKKYITVLQMVQFLIVFLHSAQLLYTDCNYPKFSLVFVLPNAGFFMYLFNDFYVKAYNRKNSKALLELPDTGKKNSGKDHFIKTNKNGLVKCKKGIGKPSSKKIVNINNNYNDDDDDNEKATGRWDVRGSSSPKLHKKTN